MVDSKWPRDARQTRINEEAAEWLLRLEDDKIDAGARAAFVLWLKVSPEHVAAIMFMGRFFDWLEQGG